MTKTRDLGGVTLLTIAAAILRIPWLTQPMGSDEAATFLYYASHPLHIALTIYGSPNNHILHSALMHIAFQLFGGAEWALRLPAFLAGVAIVPLTFATSRTLTRHGALLGAALAAAAPVLIDYSTDGRGYTMLCCFVLICTAAMAEIVRGGSAKATAIFAVSAALGFYTIPVMLYPFAMLAVWGWKKGAKASIAAICLTIVLYAPVIFVSGVSSLTSNPYVRPLSISAFTRGLLPYLDAVRAQMFAGIPVVVQIVIAMGFVAGLVWKRPPSASRVGAAALGRSAAGGVRRAGAPAATPALPGSTQSLWIGIVAVIVLVCAQRVLPFPRVWLPFLLLIFITAAASWTWSEGSEAAVAAMVVIALAITGLATPRVRETGELRAVREITRELKRRARPGDPVLALPPSEMPLAYYYSPAEVLRPDLTKPRLFVVENRDYGQTLPRTLAFFRIDPKEVVVRKTRDFGSAALYELRR